MVALFMPGASTTAGGTDAPRRKIPALPAIASSARRMGRQSPGGLSLATLTNSGQERRLAVRNSARRTRRCALRYPWQAQDAAARGRCQRHPHLKTSWRFCHGRRGPNRALIVETIVTEWLSVVTRWPARGRQRRVDRSSFYFIHLDLSLKARGGLPDRREGRRLASARRRLYHMMKYSGCAGRCPTS